MTNYFDNQTLVEIILKWKKHLLAVALLAIVLSAVFSSSTFIKPKFKSTARIYPSNNIYTFSDESESEQLLEIINSLDIKLRVIEAFNLSEVYKISKDDPQYLTNMLGKFNDNVSFKKTEYETVEIQVLDTDPNRACAMCDSIIVYLDNKIGELHRVKYKEVADIVKKDLVMVTNQSDSVNALLNDLRVKYNILDFKVQAEEITKGMVKVLADQKKNTSGGKELAQWMNNLSEKGSEYEMLYKHERSLVSQIDSLKKLQNQAISSMNRKISFGQRIENPVPADKKSFPVRWLIVLLSTGAALFVALLAIFILETPKKV